MTAGDIVPVSGEIFEQTLASASPGLLREMIREFAQKMMDADVEVRCSAGYGEVTPDRVNSRNGYRRREWDTRGSGRSSWRSSSCARDRTSRASWEYRRRAEQVAGQRDGSRATCSPRCPSPPSRGYRPWSAPSPGSPMVPRSAPSTPHVVEALEARLPQAAAHLDQARDDILSFTAFPGKAWRQIWSSNPQEPRNKEFRRRTDVVGIFPGRDATICLAGAVLAEQNDEWTESRRYMGLEILAACR